jgi:hypothetical protein
LRKTERNTKYKIIAAVSRGKIDDFGFMKGARIQSVMYNAKLSDAEGKQEKISINM